MANQEHVLHPDEVYDHRNVVLTVISGSIAEGFAGMGASVLAILGLANVLPFLMLYVSTIVIGVALLLNGIAIASRFSKLISDAEEENVFHRVELGSGATAETMGGVAGITLGILALIGMMPMVLIPIAAIVFGSATFLGSGISFRLSTIEIAKAFRESTSQGLAREIIAATADVQLLVGIAAITLGILALIGIAPVTLSLIAMLIIGAANFLSGTAVTGRMFGALHHR